LDARSSVGAPTRMQWLVLSSSGAASAIGPWRRPAARPYPLLSLGRCTSSLALCSCVTQGMQMLVTRHA
jgi:hypothetical protein